MFRLALPVGLLALALVQDKPPLPVDDLPADLTAAPPLGLPDEIPDPPDNPFSAERLMLGRRLFFDPILSADRTVSCASCHEPAHGFAGREPVSLGVLGRRTTRNAPTLLNRAFGRSFMWDGRFSTLEEQVVQPIENELEMGLPLEEALARLAVEPAYAAAFAGAYEDGLTRDNLGRALATFVRRLVIGDSPIDRFRSSGDHAALTPLQRTGLWVYESKGGCWKCHAGDNFTDESFHNTGVGVVAGEPEPGRAAVTGDEADRGRFKTPTLRGLVRTAPYMHDGSVATLHEVVEFYRRGGNANPRLDGRLEPIELTEHEVEALVAFLEGLSLEAQ
jgi:cytochrome c peroxidase